MQRVWNEMTADRRRGALGGRGGVKMGDFGVGGRVYVSKVNLRRLNRLLKWDHNVSFHFLYVSFYVYLWLSTFFNRRTI